MYLGGGPDLPWEGAILRGEGAAHCSDTACEGAGFRGNDMRGHARRHSAVGCAKMAEPMIEMPFVLWTRVGPRKHV